MKPLIKKVLIAVCCLPFGAATMIGSCAAQTGQRDISEAKYTREKTNIESDLARISLDREAIRSLEAQCKKYKETGSESAQIINKKELAKAKADLTRDKAYVKADKEDLLYSYQLAIKSHKDELKKDKKLLKTNRERLENSIDKGDDVAAAKYASAVASYYRQISNDKLALQDERHNRNSDLVAINKKVESSEGQSVAVLYSENAVASIKNINFNRLYK